MISLFIYLFFLVTCFLVGVYYYKELTTSLRHLFWLVVITLFVEAIGTYNLIALKKVAGWVFHIYQPFEYYLVSAYFLQIIRFPKIRKIILISIPLVILANVLNFLFIQGPNELSTYTFLLAAFLFCIWSCFYFVQLLRNEAQIDQTLEHNPHFWVCTGILFFYTGTYFQMGFSNIIFKHNVGLAQKLYYINHLLNCILYGMITYGFLCQSKYQKS
jgi:hypothetical protein